MLIDTLRDLRKNDKVQKFTVYGFGQAINVLSPLLVIPYILNVIGENGLGKTGIAMSLAFILIVVVDYSSYIKSVKDVSINRADPQRLSEILASVYLAKVLLFVIILLGMLLASGLISYLRSELALFGWSLFIVLGQLFNPTWFLQGIENFKMISAINIISKIVYVSAVFLAISEPGDYVFVNMWLGLGILLPSLPVTAWLFIKYSVSRERNVMRKSIAIIKGDFSFCLSQLLFAFRQYSPILIVGMLLGNAAAGQFKIVEQIVMMFRTYFQMVFKFSLGMVSFEIFQDYSQGMRFWKRINGANLVFVAMLLVLIGLNEHLVLYFFNVAGKDMDLYSSYLSLGLLIPLFIGITLAQEQLMFSFGKNREYIRITFFITALSTVLLMLLLQIFGLQGAFASLLAVELALAVIYATMIRQHIPLPKIES